MKTKYFIQKNTPQLRKKLEELGIKRKNNCKNIEWFSNLFISNGKYQYFPQGWPSKKDVIYVKDEEELFKYLKDEI